MTAIVAAAVVVVLIVVLVAWTRLRSGHSDRRSMESYGHGLAALGDVAKRSSPSASVRVLPRGDVGKAHIRTDAAGEAGERPRPLSASGPSGHLADTGQETGRDRVEWAPAARRTSAPESPGEAADEDADGEVPSWVTPAEPPRTSISAPSGGLHFEDAAGADGGERAATTLTSAGHRPPPVRRAVVGGVAALGVVAIVVVSILLTGHGTPTAGPPSTTRGGSGTMTTSPAASTTTTTVLKPVSTTANSATFKLPRAHYILRFSASQSDCWVGIEPSSGGGTYLWTRTVAPAGHAAYKGTEPVIVQLGAPKYVSVSVDNMAIRIPAGVTSYDLVFTS